MSLEPYDWQNLDLDLLARNNWTGLLTIEVGGGKTVTATHAIKRSNAAVTLIIAPLSTHSSAWGKTARAILGTEVRVIGAGNKAQRNAMFDFEMGYPGIYIATPQYVTRSDVSSWSGDMLIVDEIHTVATMRAKAQRKISGYHFNDGAPLSSRFGMRLALSGTPARQNFENMWSTMRFLWPHLNNRGQIAHDNAFMWMADRMNYETVYTAQRDQFGKPKTVKKYLWETEPGRLIAECPVAIIHKRRERCCAAHPNGFLSNEKPQELERIVPLNPAQKKHISELQNHMLTYLSGNPMVTEISLTQQQRIRQICLGVPQVEYTDDGEARVSFASDCASPFADEVFEILTDLEDNEPVIIFMDSQKFASILTSRLVAAGIAAAEFSGVTRKERGEYQRRFGIDIRVLVAVTSSIGTGTDELQTKCNTEIILEQPVSLTVKTQSEARLDRMGQKRQVQRYIVKDDLGYADGRIDEHVTKQLLLNKSIRKGL